MDKTNFTPFRKRNTYWSDEKERVCVHNIPTIIPPNIPAPILDALLLRMQIEESCFKLENGYLEVILFQENSIDKTNWEKMEDAVESRCRESTSAEMRSIVHEIDEMFKY